MHSITFPTKVLPLGKKDNKNEKAPWASCNSGLKEDSSDVFEKMKACCKEKSDKGKDVIKTNQVPDDAENVC